MRESVESRTLDFFSQSMAAVVTETENNVLEETGAFLLAEEKWRETFANRNVCRWPHTWSCTFEAKVFVTACCAVELIPLVNWFGLVLGKN